MANTQYTPYPMMDWSSEISGGSPTGSGSPAGNGTPAGNGSPAGVGGPAATITGNGGPAGNGSPAGSGNPAGAGGSAGAHASTTTTTTTTSSAAAGAQAAPSTTTTTTNHTAASASAPAAQTPQSQVPAVARNEFAGSTGTLDLETHQPIEVIEAPASLNEAFLGSLKSMLLRNRGNFVTATFLIGTQGTTAWEGILHDVGNDYLIIFQPGRERYIACDIYSLKYIEFYDTRRRAMCEDVLRQNGMENYI